MYRYKSVGFFKWIMPSLLWKIKEEEKVIYLTFDDGPHPEITSWVMTLLDEYEAKATFFCVGENVSRYPEMLNQLHNKGHRTGNHTHNHLDGWKTATDVYVMNTAVANKLIHSTLFRPPYGHITPRQSREIAKHYRIIMWSLLARDFEPDLDTGEAKNSLKKHSAPGSIVLFHDSIKAEKNLRELLPWYLQEMKTAGYSFKAIPL